MQAQEERYRQIRISIQWCYAERTKVAKHIDHLSRKAANADFSKQKALDMLEKFGINEQDKIKSLSKGTREKVQIVLVMSREAKLYLLDEPMGGVDPAAREYILRTIISNYNEDATVVITTHLISDIENVLDEVVFIKQGEVYLKESVDDIRTKYNKSVDALFREVFVCY